MDTPNTPENEENKQEEIDLAAPMEFDEDPIVVPVTVKSKDGETREYTLEEMGCKDREGYLSASGKRVKMTGGAINVGGMSFDGLHAELLCRCMYHKEEHKRITPAEVAAFRSGMAAKLFTRAQAINGLDQGAKERAKNA